jgi:hypothetical protein
MEGLQPEQLYVLFRWFKEGPPGAIPLEHEQRSLGLLQAVTWEDAGTSAAVERLADWHDTSPAGARRWLQGVLQMPDRVLFWVKDVRGEALGHVGLSHLDAENGTITISDVLHGAPGVEGLMTAALACLGDWVNQSLKLRPRREGERRAA